MKNVLRETSITLAHLSGLHRSRTAREKVFNRGLYVCAGAVDVLTIEKNSTDL